jgi:dienelactone hydrolase
MVPDMKKPAAILFLFPLLLALSACNRSIGARTELAADTAHGQLPVHALVQAGAFELASYARVNEPGGVARIYIEGDGLAWLGSREPSLNPTPTDPIALKLAALDAAPNVIWLARPCQYEGFSGDCAMEYWTSKRFAPEVVDAYVQALDHLKQQYHFTGFELIGFSGGGAVAALVAANRHDIVNLRTVAGNLDHDAFNALHHVSPMPSSLNPRDDAQKLAKLPQLHVTGGKDIIMPAVVYDSYAKASGNSPCVHHLVVDNATHEEGWEEAWPKVLAQPVACGQ